MIAPHQVAEIRRLREVEGWRVGTIARQLALHRGTVVRALRREGLLAPARQRGSKLDAFVPWLREQLAAFPTLAASVLYEMARRRGYAGGADHFRHRLKLLGLRPQKAPEAFLELRAIAGEQAQVDWADCGEREVSGGTRRLYAFVMVLSFSRMLFVRFCFDARLSSFLAAHREAFDRLGGVPRCVLYDNLKSAVLERVERAIRFHPRLLELADHYGFEPRPVGVRRGNEKGRVERAIRYLRTTFLPLRGRLDLETLNAEVDRWVVEIAGARPWQEDRARTVLSAFKQEAPHLRAVASPFPAHELVTVVAGKVPYVRFDANRYSIPPERVRRTLSLAVEPHRLRIFDGTELVAAHPRSYAKGTVIEDPAHHDALLASKRKARLGRQQNRLLRAVPRAADLLLALSQRQHHLLAAVEELVRLLDEHGASELALAVAEALAAGAPHPHAVRQVLDRRRHARGQRPPLPIALPDDPRVRDLVVTPHRLADYDPKPAGDPEEGDD